MPKRSFPDVLTLVATPPGELDAAAVEALAADLSRLGARLGAPRPLAPGHAWDLPFSDLDPLVAEERARGLADRRSLTVDVAAQPAAGRRKKLLVADMESTVIANEMLDELAERVGRQGEIEALTGRAMNGEIEFADALRQRVALLEGLPVSVLDEVMERVVVTPGAAELVATMAAHGAATALLSGGFDVFAERLRAQLGFDVQEANRLEVAGGRLTGRVVEPIRDRHAKLDALQRLCAAHELRPADAAAVGDGANDLAMLAAAGLGVAFHAKPKVVREARFRIDHGGLDTLLYFQGYRLDEHQGGDGA